MIQRLLLIVYLLCAKLCARHWNDSKEKSIQHNPFIEELSLEGRHHLCS